MRMKIKFGERFNFVVYDKRPETDAKRKKPQIKRSYCNIGVSRVRRVDDNSQPTVNDDSSSNNSIVDSQDSLGTIQLKKRLKKTFIDPKFYYDFKKQRRNHSFGKDEML